MDKDESMVNIIRTLHAETIEQYKNDMETINKALDIGDKTVELITKINKQMANISGVLIGTEEMLRIINGKLDTYIKLTKGGDSE